MAATVCHAIICFWYRVASLFMRLSANRSRHCLFTTGLAESALNESLSSRCVEMTQQYTVNTKQSEHNGGGEGRFLSDELFQHHLDSRIGICLAQGLKTTVLICDPLLLCGRCLIWSMVLLTRCFNSCLCLKKYLRLKKRFYSLSKTVETFSKLEDPFYFCKIS